MLSTTIHSAIETETAWLKNKEAHMTLQKNVLFYPSIFYCDFIICDFDVHLTCGALGFLQDLLSYSMSLISCLSSASMLVRFGVHIIRGCSKENNNLNLQLFMALKAGKKPSTPSLLLQSSFKQWNTGFKGVHIN